MAYNLLWLVSYFCAWVGYIVPVLVMAYNLFWPLSYLCAWVGYIVSVLVMTHQEIRNDASNDREKTSTTIPVHIPEEIILQILSRLPVKSLLRFRSACKLWKSIIDDASFVDIHLAHGTNSRIAFSFLKGGPTHMYSVNLGGAGPAVPLHNLPALNGYTQQDIANARFWVLESLNGLMLLRSYLEEYYYICNPSTGKLIMLPPSEWHSNDERDVVLTYSEYNLGYDHIDKKYRVLHMYEICPATHNGHPEWYRKGLQVYTLGETGWREVSIDESTLNRIVFNIVGESICVHGAIHWFITCKRTEVLNLVAFDLQSEEFRFSPLPQALSDKYFRLHSSGLMKFEGVTPLNSAPKFHLNQAGGRVVILYREMDDLMTINLWVLEDYESKLWIDKKIQLPCLPTLSMCPNASSKTVEILLDPCAFPLDNSFKPIYLKETTDGLVKGTDLPEWIFECEPANVDSDYYLGPPADRVCVQTCFVESLVPLEGTENELVFLPKEEEVGSDDDF